VIQLHRYQIGHIGHSVYVSQSGLSRARRAVTRAGPGVCPDGKGEVVQERNSGVGGGVGGCVELGPYRFQLDTPGNRSEEIIIDS
jgi:hypothetical protein